MTENTKYIYLLNIHGILQNVNSRDRFLVVLTFKPVEFRGQSLEVDVQGSSAPQLLHEDVNDVAVLEVVVTDLVIGSQPASIKAIEKKLFNDLIKVMTKNDLNRTVPKSNRFLSQ